MATLTTLLTEALFDEKRIVTYMYLSRRGNVSCVEAIKTMKELYEERKNDDHLNAVYSLIGQLKANGTQARRVMLVREDKLEKAKSTFEKVVSCDIYSLQTSVIKNLNVLYGIDKADEDEYADQDAANSMVRCTQLAEEGRRARSITPLLWSSSDDEPLVPAVKIEKQLSETKASTPIRPPVAKQSSLSAAFARSKPLPPPEKTAAINDTKPSVAKAVPARSEKRPSTSPAKMDAPQAKKTKKNDAKKKRRVRIDSESDEDGDEEQSDERDNKSNAKLTNSISHDSMKDMFSSGSMKDMFSSGGSPKDIFSSSSSPERERSPTPPAKSPSPPPPPRRSPRKSAAKNAIESDDDDDFVPTAPKKVLRQEHVAETFKDAKGFLVTKEVTKTVVVDEPVEARQKTKEPEKALRPVQEPAKKRSGKQAVPSQTKISNFFGKK